MKNPIRSYIYNEYSLEEQIRRECEAMAKYAFASGRTVPEALVESLQTLSTQESRETGETVEAGKRPSEADAAEGKEAPDTTTSTSRARALAKIHKDLAEIVAPATPRTILLLAIESAKGGFFHFLGPVPLIRRMMLAAIIALVSFIVVSMSKDVNTVSITENVFMSSGTALLKNLLFLLSAAGLGASFAGLFQANRYVAHGTFDPQYESSYWIRFVLGLMAGIMLAELIPVDPPRRGEPRGNERRSAIGRR